MELNPNSAKKSKSPGNPFLNISHEDSPYDNPSNVNASTASPKVARPSFYVVTREKSYERIGDLSCVQCLNYNRSTYLPMLGRESSKPKIKHQIRHFAPQSKNAALKDPRMNNIVRLAYEKRENHLNYLRLLWRKPRKDNSLEKNRGTIQVRGLSPLSSSKKTEDFRTILSKLNPHAKSQRKAKARSVIRGISKPKIKDGTNAYVHRLAKVIEHDTNEKIKRLQKKSIYKNESANMTMAVISKKLRHDSPKGATKDIINSRISQVDSRNDKINISVFNSFFNIF